MDLPKGIVEDDKRIYRQVANLSQLPPEVIKTFWRVYTITNRQLYDPTARRLENFWWHVWGSDRRHLKAEVIAAIWQRISYGPSFVPLKGSPNRYEPPVDPHSARQYLLDDGLDRLLPHVPEPPSKPSEQPTLRELSASSSRPPPPHPILKKPRGNSKSGPRPTARFVSPPESEGEETETMPSRKEEKKEGAEQEPEEEEDDDDDEDEDEVEGQVEGEHNHEEDVREPKPSVNRHSSGTTEASVREGPLRSSSSTTTMPSLSDKSIKKRPGPTKKFVVSTSTTKRRPHLSRRHSSQSSAGSSEHASKGGSSAGSRFSGSQQESLTSNTEITSARTTPDSHADGTPPLSAKALGKRPDVRPSPASPLLRGQKANRHEKQQKKQLLPPPLDDRPQREDCQLPAPPSDISRESRTEVNGSEDKMKTGSDGGIAEQISTSAPRGQASHHMVAPKMERASSHAEHSGPRKPNLGRTTSHGLLSNATAATSNVAATGQVSKLTDEPDARVLEALGAFDGDAPGSPHLTRNTSTTSLFRPTMPSPTPSVPMARSRSQLTLLLEREKERLGDKGRRKGFNQLNQHRSRP
ncbi:hypothetical protein SODALDRAFT_321398 [Sodiomyces alkalinus F11]|uniref:Nitrogen regulatory protein areA GATA-like domain-containing protein n=1 Tax=Sodiomyces alkalinus (strain CBS 110278 / VKM F-3762 / F11) TaxID=1314773 RepID=A0A3N2PK91_SODAK|nr:hypothetical protein SODALDRAFT_321398 [Sodiomyces alkalinus F11]ROT34736.1 hypothetical protein SODALDRAFT_321398 [Sodiomyces alkalinus F11]